MGELETKFGELLQLERKRQNMALGDLSTELKISEDYLVSIEKGDAGSLPSELYYKLFAKTYAERLGIDYTKTLDAIREELGESLEPETKSGSVRKDSETPKGSKPPQAGEAPEEEEEETEPSDEKKFVKRVVYISAAIVVVFLLVLVGYKFILDDGGSASSDGSMTEGGQAAGAGDASSTNAEFAGYTWGTPESAQPESLKVTLTAREQSWATVLCDGDTVLYQNLTPWREYNVKAAYRVLIGIGIPRLVEIKLNGQPVNLVDPNTGRISRVEINQSNWTTFEPPERTERRRPSPPPTTPVNVDTAKQVTPEAAAQPETTVKDSL